MPRKQRFKPSRKPKPIPQNEDALAGRPVSHPTAQDDSESMAPARDDRSQDDQEPEARSS